jgi:2-dehydro-3-deoxyphosphogluconate aldolase/(4S)-4-hydroxy-2-oxoglutarate aldolase
MNDILKKAGQLGIIPVIKIENAENAVQLGKALLAGNLPVAEITFRTAAAEEAITRITGELPGLLVGAGTVLKTEQVDKAVKAGAKFIVAPGFNPKVVDYCIQRGIPVTPGITSPTELEMALDRGLDVVKFFPAEACGGLPTLKAIAEPYDGVMFIPTGGINEKNLAQYLSFKRVLACGGSWMVKADMISAGRFDEITRLAIEAVAIVKTARK